MLSRVLIALVVVLPACGSTRGGDNSAGSPTVVVPVAPLPPPVVGQEESVPPPRQPPRTRLLNPSEATLRAPDLFNVLFRTSAGEFRAEVHRDWAPLGVDRFYNLVNMGFYDGLAFFRVVQGFIVQFGIHSDPNVSALWRKASIPDDPVVGSNLRATLTFAMAGHDTRTTQLFINLSDNARLDAMGFAPFGKIVEGFNVVESISSVHGERPQQSRIFEVGNAYLQQEFPQLDYIHRAVIVY